MSNARLPTVTSDIPRDLRLFLDRVRETLSGGVITRNDVVHIIRETSRTTPSTPSTPTTSTPGTGGTPNTPITDEDWERLIEEIEKRLDESLLNQLLLEPLSRETMRFDEELARLRGLTFTEHTELQKQFEDAWKTFDLIDTEIQNILGAPEWSPTVRYTAGARVQYEGKLYEAKVTHGPSATPPPQAPNNWTHIASLAMLKAAVDEQATALLALTARVSVTEAGYESVSTALLQAGLAYETPDGRVVATDAAIGLFSRITDIDGRLNATSALLNSVKSVVSTANGTLLEAQALDKLKTEVTAARGQYTSLASRLTGVDTALAGKASASAFSLLESKVTELDGELTSESRRLDSVQAVVSDSKGNLLRAGALDSLQTEVTAARGGSTSLASRISGVETEVDGKVDASAFSTLENEVEDIDGRLRSTSSKTDLVYSGLGYDTNKPVTATAFNQLKTQVENPFGTGKSLASSVTELYAETEPDAIFAAMQEEGMVWADNASSGASWTLKLRAKDASGSAQVGLGLSAVKEGSQWVADFRILASRFAVLDPYGAIRYPLKIVDGVVYIDEAFIGKLSIGTSQLKQDSVNRTVWSTGWGGASTSLSIPQLGVDGGRSYPVFVLFAANILAHGGGGAATVQAVAKGGWNVGPSFGISVAEGFSATAIAFGSFWLAGGGAHTITGEVTISGGNHYVGSAAVFASCNLR